MLRFSVRRLGSATLLALAAALFLPVLAGWQALHTRAALLADAEQNTRTLSHSLAQHAARTIEAIDIVLADIVERVANPDGQDLKSYIERRAALLKQVRWLVVADAAGNIVADSTPAHPPVNIADRQHYLWHKKESDLRLHIGDWQISKLTQAPVLPMSRRIIDRSGAFGGLAVASLDPAYLRQFYRSLDVGPHGALGMWNNNGRLMARYPDASPVFEPGNAPPSLLDVPSAKLSTSRAPSPVDGVDRIVTFEHLNDYPVVVSAAVAVDDVLAPWWHDVFNEGLVLGCGSLALTGLAFGLERQRRAALLNAAATREADRRYKVLADTTSDVIMQISLDLRREYVSPACRLLVGHEPEEMVSKDLQSHMHPDDAPAVMTKLRTLTSGTVEGDTERATYRVRHKDGHWVWVDAVANLLRDPDTGAPRTLIASLRDVTERQRFSRHLERAKAAAENAARQQSEFVANMSHELRTPLTGILGIHDLLQRDPGLGPEQRRYLTMARDAGRSLLSIVNDVLDFSKIEAGQLAIEKVTFHLRDLVEACGELAGEAAREKGLRFDIRMTGDDVSLVGDPARLRQVLLNLMTNAVKFTGHGGVTVHVAYLAETSRMRIEVTDTGIGVPKDKQPLMFARFSQADASTTRRYGGTGLGLAICKRLVELMGGEIGVHSVDGQGSTFWFDVPLPLAPNETERSTPEASQEQASGGYRVLLAEDNIVNQEIIAAMLMQRGHIVTVVDNGAAAAAAMRAQPRFDVVLMDIQMPVMDGLSATQAIRRNEVSDGLVGVPIVGLTANAMVEDVERCLAVGMTTHVAKPIDWVELFATIDRVMSPATERPAHAPSESEGSSEVLDTAKLDGLIAVIGRERVTRMLGAFARDVETRVGKLHGAGLEELRSQCHTMVSTAGQFGFVEMARLCAEVEDAARAGHGLDRVDGLRAVAERAIGAARDRASAEAA